MNTQDLQNAIVEITSNDLCLEHNITNENYKYVLDNITEDIGEMVMNNILSNTPFKLNEMVEYFFEEDPYDDMICHCDDIYDKYYEPQMVDNYVGFIFGLKERKKKACAMVLVNLERKNLVCFDCCEIIQRYMVEIINEETDDEFDFDMEDYKNNQMDQIVAIREQTPDEDWTKIKIDPEALMPFEMRLSHY